jgi:hypothetical protein
MLHSIGFAASPRPRLDATTGGFPGSAFDMQLILFVSGLLDVPAPTLTSADAAAPALTRLLAAGAAAGGGVGTIAALCDALGIARQDDEPVAAWLAHGAGLDAGDDHYWLCADPVSMSLGEAAELGAPLDDLSADDAAMLVASLNTHFAADGLEWHAYAPQRWLVKVSARQRILTTSPEATVDQPMSASLPRGDDSVRWRRWASEMQMLLHDHPVNVRRETQGRRPVNAVWVWGGGTLEPVPSAPVASVYADDALVAALARSRGASVAPLPPNLDVLRDRAPPSPALVWLHAFPTSDLPARLAELEVQWFAPARGAFHNATLAGLEIVLSGRRRSARVTARRLSLARRLRTWAAAPRLSRLLGPLQER